MFNQYPPLLVNTRMFLSYTQTKRRKEKSSDDAKHNKTLRTNMQNKFCQNNKLQVNTGTTDSVHSWIWFDDTLLHLAANRPSTTELETGCKTTAHDCIEKTEQLILMKNFTKEVGKDPSDIFLKPTKFNFIFSTSD